jgi:rhamnosyltransferase subunit B
MPLNCAGACQADTIGIEYLDGRKGRFDAARGTDQLRRLLSNKRMRAKAAQVRTVIEEENGATAAADAVESACR